jgi:hypothetical protein
VIPEQRAVWRRDISVLTAWAWAVLAVVMVLVTLASAPTASAQVAPTQASVAGSTVLSPVTPCRLFDSRETPDAGRIDASTLRIQVAGRCNVPAGARAAALNIVATDTLTPGFVAVWPSGSARPTVSSLNYIAGSVVSNSAVVEVSSGGAVDVYTHGRANVVVDITGVFVDPGGASSSGRFVPTTPARLLDTRETGQRGSSELQIPLPPGVPGDATALAVSITAVDAASGGFLTAYPAGTSRPFVSVVNTDANDRTRANLVLVPVTPNGFTVYRHMPTDVVVDFWGWFTGASDHPSTIGMFVPQAPVRVWDSRSSHDPVHAGGTVEKQLVPGDAAAVISNVTVAEPVGAGFVSVHAAGTPRPFVSSLNYRWTHPVGALTVAQTSTRGVGFHASTGAHMIVDVAGWFTGAPVAATAGVTTNAFPPPTSPVLVISDSAFAGIRWSNSLGYLQGAAWDARLESCRRLIGVSCSGREGYAPQTAAAELSLVPAGAYRTLVVATGYNDWSGAFPSGVDSIMTLARAKGIDRVVWLTYREQVGYVSPGGTSNQASFAANNRYLRSVLASGRYPELILADWDGYSRWSAPWFAADGVHLTIAGAPQAAMYVSRKLAHLERRPCPGAIGGPATPGGWCADPDVTGPPG